MGLEAAVYIDELVTANPVGTDDRSFGDDHIRMLKRVLKNSFPNISGPVTMTDVEMNNIIGNLVPPGIISMWSGTLATIPSGWKLCNGVGTISNGNPVPNIIDRFIIASQSDSGGTYNIGATGGSKDQTVTGTTAGTALTVAQLPNHSHGFGGGRFVELNNASGPGNNGNGGYSGGQNIIGISATDTAGSDQTHNHAISITTVDANLPPYYALAFIIKN